MTREIRLNDRLYQPIPHAGLCAWITANGLDPKDLPVDQTVSVDEVAGTLTVTVFPRNPDGSFKLVRGALGGYVKEARIVPLMSAPEDHFL